MKIRIGSRSGGRFEVGSQSLKSGNPKSTAERVQDDHRDPVSDAVGNREEPSLLEQLLAASLPNASHTEQITMDRSNDSIKLYLDYLDKEMTIQGVLSVFSVAASALLSQKLLFLGLRGISDLANTLKLSPAYYLLTSIFLLLIAAFFFYQERSELTLLIGKFSLALAREDRGIPVPEDSKSLLDCFIEADSWMLWFFYRAALVLLATSAIELTLALAAGSFWQSFLGRSQIWLIPVILCLCGIYILWLYLVLSHRDANAVKNANERYADSGETLTKS